MSDFITIEQIDAATAYIRERISLQPQIGLVLGSGLGALAEAVEDPVIILTREIPHWPISTVAGHEGRLVIGRLEGKIVLVLQGRAHYYEGHSMSRIGLPVRVMQRLGVHTLILTNAAGGLNPEFSPGDLMLITDHLSLLPMTGPNPLRGPNLDEFGPRFPDMSQVYEPGLLASSAAGQRCQCACGAARCVRVPFGSIVRDSRGLPFLAPSWCGRRGYVHRPRSHCGEAWRHASAGHFGYFQ